MGAKSKQFFRTKIDILTLSLKELDNVLQELKREGSIKMNEKMIA